jgi:DNA polymerase
MGADTGRWAGRLIQPQNFPRPSLDDPEALIPLVMAGDYEAIAEVAHPMEGLSSLLRSMLVARAPARFLCADFSAIEGWVVAWLAGQEGMTSYEEMAARIFNKKVSEIAKDSEERMVGKVAVLGCGYGMGRKKFRDTVKAWTGLEISEELADKAVTTYRSVNDQIQSLWYELERAALEAVAQPGKITRAGRRGLIRYRVKGQYLWCVLPSGRPLCYPLPKLVDSLTPWGEVKKAVEISTTNSYTRKWERRTLYGGLQTENVVQAVARDVMAEAMLRVEEAGYPVVLTVHDEILAEAETGSLDHFNELMSVTPEWAPELVVKVEGWEGERYRK